MYQLWHDKNKQEMLLAPMEVYGHKYIIPGKVTVFNQNHYICDDRKILREFAKELKQKWIEELEYKLEKANQMKIKNKYK
ncbi:MAG: hypothetical protein ACRC18_06845 [Cetobacterium sp.]